MCRMVILFSQESLQKSSTSEEIHLEVSYIFMSSNNAVIGI